MTVLTALMMASLLPAQEKFPDEDHVWRRFNAGTWIKSRVTIEIGGSSMEKFQKLTLKEKTDDSYLVEETNATEGEEPNPNATRTSNPVHGGVEKVTAAGKEHACTMWSSKGKNDGGPLESTYWYPEKGKNPVRIKFKAAWAEGEMLAVSMDEKVKVADRTLSCVKMEGKIRGQGGEGTIVLWISHELPSSQARLELVLKNEGGEVKIRFEALEIHEQK